MTILLEIWALPQWARILDGTLSFNPEILVFNATDTWSLNNPLLWGGGDVLFRTTGRPLGLVCLVLSLSVCVRLLPPHRLPDQCDGCPGPAAIPHPPEHCDALEGQARGLQTSQQRPAPSPRHHGGHHAECGLLTPMLLLTRVLGPQNSPEWSCSKNPPGIGQNLFRKDLVHLYNQKKACKLEVNYLLGILR